MERYSGRVPSEPRSRRVLTEDRRSGFTARPSEGQTRNKQEQRGHPAASGGRSQPRCSANPSYDASNSTRNATDRVASTVPKRMRAACHANTLNAQAELEAFASELAKTVVADGLHEGIAETLTILRFGVSPPLSGHCEPRTSIESVSRPAETAPRTSKCWHGGQMAPRWSVGPWLPRRPRSARRCRGCRGCRHPDVLSFVDLTYSPDWAGEESWFVTSAMSLGHRTDVGGRPDARDGGR